jgi:tetratricopeptide (TPR) repeat protein
MKNKYTYLIIIFLIIASCTAFGRIACNDFINFDDNLYITENNHIKSGINQESIKWISTAVVVSNWHPLTLLSHILDWSLFGANASGHHLVSLLLHIGAVIFLFLFLNKTTNNLWPAAFAAAFFALHPLRVESVAWAAERKDVLSMFFGMACLYAYAFYAESPKLSKYLLCLTLFALALMSKPMMVTLPFVLMLLDYWQLKRWPKAFSSPVENRSYLTGRLVWEKIPFFCLTIASSIVTFAGQNKIRAVATIDSLSLFERVINAIISYAAYLGKIFWPVNLAVFYPYEFQPLWKISVSVLVITIITFAVLYYIKKIPFLFVGWFWYLGTLIPLIGLIQVGGQAMTDRHTYLPSIGIAMIIAWGIPSLIKSENIHKKILFPAGLAVLAILAVLTWKQCGFWKSSVDIWKHTLHVTNNNYLAHMRLANAYGNLGQYQRAIEYFNEVIRLKPDFSIAYN